MTYEKEDKAPLKLAGAPRVVRVRLPHLSLQARVAAVEKLQSHSTIFLTLALADACALQVQSGAARYNYTHQIKNADIDPPRQVSLTLREARRSAPRAPPSDAAGMREGDDDEEDEG